MLADLFQGFGFWAEGWGLMWGVAFCVGVLAVLVKGFDIWTEVFGLWGVAVCWIASLYSLKGSGWKTDDRDYLFKILNLTQSQRSDFLKVSNVKARQKRTYQEH